jgi:hypothetical protein
MTCDDDYHHANRTARRDGNGIFLTYTCPRCERDKLAGFRADIFAAYDPDEALDAD